MIAFHTTFPLRIGTTCVKLKPESTTSIASAEAISGCVNRVPWGIIAAAVPKRKNKTYIYVINTVLLTCTTIVRLELIFFEYELIIYILNIR